MSDRTPCNYCTYRSIKQRYEAKGLVVTKMRGWEDGTEVFAHPPDVVIERGAGDMNHPQHQYFRCWLMELPGHCVC